MASGTYTFSVRAHSDQASANLPLSVTIQERVPARLALSVDLPTVIGKPDATFRYNVTLANQGDEEVTVNMLADAPAGFTVTYKLNGQQVTSIPVEANTTKRLSGGSQVSGPDRPRRHLSPHPARRWGQHPGGPRSWPRSRARKT